jgi:hypothetical protein
VEGQLGPRREGEGERHSAFGSRAADGDQVLVVGVVDEKVGREDPDDRRTPQLKEGKE